MSAFSRSVRGRLGRGRFVSSRLAGVLAALLRTAAVFLHCYQLICCVMQAGSVDACTRWCEMVGAAQEAP